MTAAKRFQGPSSLRIAHISAMPAAKEATWRAFVVQSRWPFASGIRSGAPMYRKFAAAKGSRKSISKSKDAA